MELQPVEQHRVQQELLLRREALLLQLQLEQLEQQDLQVVLLLVLVVLVV